jgi:hypothetical protein
MRVILNIGLARDGNKNIGVGTVLRELDQRGFNLQGCYRICHSDTEITVVAEVELETVNNPVRYLAQILGQDCIAAYIPKVNKGKLIGPKAAEWGEFNPEKFILLDGTRLAQSVKEI